MYFPHCLPIDCRLIRSYSQCFIIKGAVRRSAQARRQDPPIRSHSKSNWDLRNNLLKPIIRNPQAK